MFNISQQREVPFIEEMSNDCVLKAKAVEHQ
jgi:hypothetical protein